jgi:hypothetical protein
MTSMDNQAYYRYRHDTEQQLAQSSSDPRVAATHKALADFYRQLTPPERSSLDDNL